MRRVALRFLALLLPAGLAWGQANVAIVNHVVGKVGISRDADTVPRLVKGYATLQVGDRLVIPAGAELHITYFDGGRQEIWRGTAECSVQTQDSRVLGGTVPSVTTVPPIVARQLAQVNELLNLPRRERVVTRNLLVRQDVVARDKTVADALNAYELIRPRSPETDITPELFLISVFHDNDMNSDLKWLAKEIMSRQPNHPEYAKLAQWALAASNQ